ncbi:MAG: tetratricopeptide repeat protein [Candidatus Heimdallarchaeota archaeon]|nr:tetratricopeptide repeat protein [Candidatus Heimdallarchaeota archaeon]
MEKVKSRIQGFLRRGEFDEAWIEITNAKETHIDSISLTKLGIEETRLRLFEGNYEDGIKLSHELLNTSEASNNIEIKASIILILGQLYWFQGSVEIVDELLKSNEDLFNLIENPNTKSTFINLKGNIAVDHGDHELALNYYYEGLKLNEQIGDEFEIGLAMNNIANAYRGMGEFTKAIDLQKKSLDIGRRLNYPVALAYWLVTLFEIWYDLKNNEEAKNVLIELEEVAKQNPKSKMVRVIYKLSQALNFKADNRMRNKMRAQGILEEIIFEDKSIHNQFIVMAIKHYCELLLLELKSLNNEEALEDANKAISELYEIGQAQQSFPTIVQALIMKARFTLLDGDLEQVDKLIEQALVITDEKNLKHLHKLVLEEKDLLEEEMNKWGELVRSNASMYKKIESTSILNYIQKVQKMKF